MRSSVSVQSVEARLVMESRRRIITSRGTRSKLPSPREAETGTDAGDCAARRFPDEADACNAAHCRPTISSKILRTKEDSGRRHHLREPPRTSVDHEQRVQPKARKTAHCDLHVASAAGRHSTPEDKKLQQQRPAVELGERYAQKKTETKDTCGRFRELGLGGRPAPFGSEEYLKNRRRRAAQGAEVVRQCTAGLDKMSSLISNEAARRAQSLVRRLAAEKQRKAQKQNGINSEKVPTASHSHAKDERCGNREPCAAGGPSPAAQQTVRRPWRAGASSRAWAESRRVTDESRRPGSSLQGGEVGGACNLVKEYARAAVERIVRRACLNLANRPWRLAGVRLSIDRSNHAGRRQRMLRARTSKDGPMAALVELQAAHGNLANNGTELCGWARRRGCKPRHRRLMRPRTPSDDSRRLGSTRPSPPPFPHRRHPSSAGWGRDEVGRRHEGDKNYDDSCCPQYILYGTYEACQESPWSEGRQGWISQAEDAKDVDVSNGVSAEGVPPSFRRKLGVQLPPQPCRTIGYRPRGTSCLNRATGKVTRQGGRALNLANGRSTNCQLPQRPRWDARFWVRARDFPAATTSTWETRNPSSQRVVSEQGVGPRVHVPAVGENDMPTDNASTTTTTSGGGYSASTFVDETVSSSSLATFSSSLGEETWSEVSVTADDSSAARGSPLDQLQEAAGEEAAPATRGQAGDGDAWHAEATTALHEKQAATTHKALPGLIEHARVFATRLTLLAEGQGLDRVGDSSC